jgi:hypothetical protein
MAVTGFKLMSNIVLFRLLKSIQFKCRLALFIRCSWRGLDNAPLWDQQLEHGLADEGNTNRGHLAIRLPTLHPVAWQTLTSRGMSLEFQCQEGRPRHRDRAWRSTVIRQLEHLTTNHRSGLHVSGLLLEPCQWHWQRISFNIGNQGRPRWINPEIKGTTPRYAGNVQKNFLLWHEAT